MVLLQALGRCAQVVHDLLRPGRGARVHNGGPREEGAARAQVVELVPALAGDHDERRDAEVAGDRPGRVRDARLDGVGSVIHRHEDVPPVGGREGGALGAPSQVGQVVTAVQCARQGGVRRDVRQGGLQAVDEVGGRQVLRGDEQDVLRAAGAEAGERVEQPSAQRALVGRRRCGRGAVLREDERLCFHTAYDGHGCASIRSPQQSTRCGVELPDASRPPDVPPAEIGRVPHRDRFGASGGWCGGCGRCGSCAGVGAVSSGPPRCCTWEGGAFAGRGRVFGGIMRFPVD